MANNRYTLIKDILKECKEPINTWPFLCFSVDIDTVVELQSSTVTKKDNNKNKLERQMEEES
jgi:hypothetical protein